MEAIRAWLNSSRDFTEGLALFDQFSSSEYLKGFFRQYAGHSFASEKLSRELEALLNKEQPTNIQSPDPTSPPVLSSPAANGTDTELQRQLSPLYKERTALHWNLETLPEPERKKAAFRIAFELTPQIEDLLKNGPKKPGDSISFLSLLKRRNNIRTYISRTRNVQGKEEQLAAWQEELTEIDKKIELIWSKT